jgi:GAF domain-containing protein
MPSDDSVLQRNMALLGRFFVGDRTLGETLGLVADLACGSIGRADMAGVTMPAARKQRTAVFTDPIVAAVDSAEYGTDGGPCLDAFRNQHVCRIVSTAEDTAWPEFSGRAVEYGIVSTLSLPLLIHHESVGALNLYSATGSFCDDDETAAVIFATQAAITLANSQSYWDARELSEQLGEAMRSRAVIEQAKGVLIAGGGVTPDEAFDLLALASQRQNRKLRDVAADVVGHAQDR